MGQHSIWYVIALIILCLLSCSELMINSKAMELNPVANVTTSWTNIPTNSVIVNSSRFPYDSFSPILFREGSANGSSQYVCGFYCLYNETTTANCLLGILIFHRSEYTYIINEPQFVWSANRDHPVRINATLNFTSNGNMILKDVNGTLVWSTETRGKNIVGLNLTETGNLILYDSNGTVVWQSFDHPTDVLLPGQTLADGKSLTSSTSTTNLSRGSYSLIYQSHFLSAYYLLSSPPQRYFFVDAEVLLYDIYLSYDGGNFGYKKSLAQATPQFMRLDSDGYLKVYEWGGSNWDVAGDVLTPYIGECGYPLVCGEYGICSSGQCSCPDEAINETGSFRPLNSRHPNLGCTSMTPVSCSNPKFHTLLELKNTSYLQLNQEYGFANSSKREMKLEDCKDSCLRNCSCKAALFMYNMEEETYPYSDSPRNGCFLINEVFSLAYTDGYADSVVFLKVQKSQSTRDSQTMDSPIKRSRRVQIILGSSIGAFFCLISLFAAFFLLSRRKFEDEEFDEFSFTQVPWMPTRFYYENLKAITSNFVTKLGQGGFGSVFEGTLNDGTKVAVKRLDGLGHIKKSFLAEVETIGSIHHVNLVRLIGFCAEKSHRLLVYEYMPKGSLDKWIFQSSRELSLGWELRKNIILDIAKGLAYLHEECSCKIFHLDIKPQNILLDDNFNAKVSDFGLAKLIDKDQSQVMTTMRGTPGYLAPEWWLSSIITEKVDVYSFGIVVLEIICGRKNVDRSQPEEEDMHLVTLFKRKTEEGRSQDLIDICNDDMQLHVPEIVKMTKVAKWCLQTNPSSRPSMSMVVKVIEDSIDVENNLGYDLTDIAVSASNAPVARRKNIFCDTTTSLSPVSLSEPR